jgi:putative FmdB family regulatory protein
MPLYEYRCLKCGHQLEVLQKFSDRPLRRCPECPGKLEKLISRTSFQLKGGGWYDQGYGNPSGGSGKGTGSSASPPSKSDSSSDKATTPKKKDDATGSKKSSAASA